jgi:two-component system, LytTR family, response regulator
MIPTYLIGNENKLLNQLNNDLTNFCPKLKIKQILDPFQNHLPLELESNALVFVFLNALNIPNFQCIKNLITQDSVGLICLDNKKENAYQAYQMNATEYLLQPYLPKDLIQAVDKVEQQLNINSTINKLNYSSEQVLGIPTIEGYEFIPINEIIKCEGLQSYTRIFTSHKKDIITSNNIGELRRKLEPFGFFAPHKSYIICLKQIRKYHRDGVIILQDGSEVPLARRRKEAFFERIMHL